MNAITEIKPARLLKDVTGQRYPAPALIMAAISAGVRRAELSTGETTPLWFDRVMSEAVAQCCREYDQEIFR